MQIKMISLHQPYALLVAHKLKQHETRSWSATPGGLLAIHATKRRPTFGELTVLKVDFAAIGLEKAFDRIIDELRDDRWYGAINCVATFADCTETDITFPVTRADFLSGDWKSGRWAWRLEDVQKLRDPIKVRGHQGLRLIKDSELIVAIAAATEEA